MFKTWTITAVVWAGICVWLHLGSGRGWDRDGVRYGATEERKQRQALTELYELDEERDDEPDRRTILWL